MADDSFRLCSLTIYTNRTYLSKENATKQVPLAYETCFVMVYSEF